MAATLRTAAIFIAFFLGASTSFQNAPHFYNLRGYFGFSRVIRRQCLPHKLHSPSSSFRIISAWTKRGHICLFRSFRVDLTVAMDVEINLGPDALGNNIRNFANIIPTQVSGTSEDFCVSRHDYANNSQDILSRHSVQSWDVLHRFQLRMKDAGSSSSLTGNKNKIKRGYRSCRAGRKVKERRNNLLLNIPIVEPRRPSRNTCSSHTVSQCLQPRTLTSVNVEKAATAPRLVPKCMILNARSLVKADAAPALYAELSTNNIDICFVSESWMHKEILCHSICPDGYVMVHKDRAGERAGGGVAVICRNDWKI